MPGVTRWHRHAHSELSHEVIHVGRHVDTVAHTKTQVLAKLIKTVTHSYSRAEIILCVCVCATSTIPEVAGPLHPTNPTNQTNFAPLTSAHHQRTRASIMQERIKSLQSDSAPMYICLCCTQIATVLFGSLPPDFSQRHIMIVHDRPKCMPALSHWFVNLLAQ